jgi:hypothetical protein
LALASFISVDAQNEVVGAYVKKEGMACGINATSRFPMYSVMKFPQALYVPAFLVWCYYPGLNIYRHGNIRYTVCGKTSASP